MADPDRDDRLWCPSARPEPDAVVFAVRRGEGGVAYLDEPVPVTPEVLALADPVDPREVFRFGAPCAASGCVHFSGSHCRLGERVATRLPVATPEPVPCRLRPRCRWYAERGADACRRCPMVLTLTVAPTREFAEVVLPSTPHNP